MKPIYSGDFILQTHLNSGTFANYRQTILKPILKQIVYNRHLCVAVTFFETGNKSFALEKSAHNGQGRSKIKGNF